MQIMKRKLKVMIKYFNSHQRYSKKIPVNDIFTEKVWQEITPINSDTPAYQYTFIRQKTTGGLIDLDKCFLLGKIKIKYNDDDLQTNMQINTLPWPFQTWALQLKAFVNGVSIDVADLHNTETSYVKSLTRYTYYENEDIKEINLGQLDTRVRFETMDDENYASANLARWTRAAAFVNGALCLVMDKVCTALHNDGK